MSSGLTDLELAPLTLVSEKDVLCAAQYVLERRLAAYVKNIQHGVAAFCEQLVVRYFLHTFRSTCRRAAPASIPCAGQSSEVSEST